MTHAAERERTIPEHTIRKYNVDRTRYFVEAADQLHHRYSSERVRAFVVQRGECTKSSTMSMCPTLRTCALTCHIALADTAASSGVVTEVTSALPLVPIDRQRDDLSETAAKNILMNRIHDLRVNAGVFREGVDSGAPVASK